MNKKWLLLILVVIQAVIIVYLIQQYRLKARNQRAASLNFLSKTMAVKNRQTDLKYFYEPKANSIINQADFQKPFPAKYTINSDRLNERFDYDPKQAGNHHRIVTLGDSYTFGLYVNTFENYSEVLEKMFQQPACLAKKPVEVINLGVWGYDLHYSLERYRLRGIKYQPDMLIWLIKQDDLEQINEQMIPIEEQCTQELIDKRQLNDLNKPGYLECYREAITNIQTELGLKKNLERLDRIVNQYLPLLPERIVLVGLANTQASYKSWIKTLTKRRAGITYLELPNLHQNSKNYFAPNDYHPNAQGHKYLAKWLFDYLLETTELKCQ
ncbi:hypothetical protein A2313_00845 [Candidatus Roizmanbacteria bacterium RIFOXYB2_FULL_41_10]|uniref:SGNH hydrolase-type esterase domain-containing protein n=1 Tax=Candidatus Roizmanbacteria bacterium RIFOXYA1_FULL_41_12 TaxID=1802082 RepID=A0A1F7KFB4_9BACT|nr:MAG: hypothetical protein A2209_00900 [Candidatus Roizmanbacteria bacterium RIFOXYA1_FULL_41_12]OGK67241.1 MAG: hypothetical protein A2377_01340 [Candidatus Roizmanbacteria bacterium RIFOXYB1_FULL_41_27]OGK69313.1 MAG: hypothetical protein A2313_00845 [Candidatus Roizmanbacteria bacterium RIFOXYB2_FULL_41_10]OGK71771.1 MAG: hypothetical protein A2403_00210 [Candidatus Roizmanbacteria bacterium RIFOXYC1_FULL_41_16]OGK74828.1 MAG: hypothetical protein A2575_00590 [Candidatus Roizmanbacteria ba